MACPLLADRRRPGGELLVGLAGRRQAGEVALHVGGEDGDAVGAELLGEQLEGLGLAGTGRAGHQAVPVEHRRAGSGCGCRSASSRRASGRRARARSPRTRSRVRPPGRSGCRRAPRGRGRRRPARPVGAAGSAGGSVGGRVGAGSGVMAREPRAVLNRDWEERSTPPIVAGVIFKRVGEGRPYPDHGLTSKAWAAAAAAPGAPRRAGHDQGHPAARRPARRGLDVLRRPVRARRRVAGRATTSRTVCTAPCARRSSSATCCTPGCTWPG